MCFFFPLTPVGLSALIHVALRGSVSVTDEAWHGIRRHVTDARADPLPVSTVDDENTSLHAKLN